MIETFAYLAEHLSNEQYQAIIVISTSTFLLAAIAVAVLYLERSRPAAIAVAAAVSLMGLSTSIIAHLGEDRHQERVLAGDDVIAGSAT